MVIKFFVPRNPATACDGLSTAGVPPFWFWIAWSKVARVFESNRVEPLSSKPREPSIRETGLEEVEFSELGLLSLRTSRASLTL